MSEEKEPKKIPTVVEPDSKLINLEMKGKVEKLVVEPDSKLKNFEILKEKKNEIK